VALVLSDILTAARDRSPWFFRSRVPDAILARFLSDTQNELIGAATRRDPQYLAQTAHVVIALDGSDAPGTAGAGTSGGVPGTVDDNGSFSTTESNAGSLVEANVTADTGATVWMSDRVCASATSTTIQSTGASRTSNQDLSRVVVITKGTGLGQRREIASNTTDTWTVSQAWTTVPDTSSMFDIVTPSYGADNAIGVVTSLQATTVATGYLVKVSSQGVPYIDFTQPLVASIADGVPLPSMQFPLDATVYYANGDVDAARIVDRSRRFDPFTVPTIVIDNQQVYPVGDTQDWYDIQSVAIRYVPIAPVFTSLTDTFLLPDHARPVLVAKAEAFMALRVMGMEGVNIDPAPHAAAAKAAEQSFLANVMQAKRGRYPRIKELW